MNLGTHFAGVSLYDHLTLWIDFLILVVIIMEGPFYERKKKEVEKAWKKFMKDTKKYWTRKEDA